MITLGIIKKEIENRGKQIAMPTMYLPSMDKEYRDWNVRIQIDDDGMLSIYKFGKEEELYSKTAVIDAFMFDYFHLVIQQMSWEYEMKHRDKHKDERRTIHQKQEEWMRILNDEWAQKIQKLHQKELLDAPYDDQRYMRLEYMLELSESGKSDIEIQKLALKKYPRP